MIIRRRRRCDSYAVAERHQDVTRPPGTAHQPQPDHDDDGPAHGRAKPSGAQDSVRRSTARPPGRRPPFRRRCIRADRRRRRPEWKAFDQAHDDLAAEHDDRNADDQAEHDQRHIALRRRGDRHHVVEAHHQVGDQDRPARQTAVVARIDVVLAAVLLADELYADPEQQHRADELEVRILEQAHGKEREHDPQQHGTHHAPENALSADARARGCGRPAQSPRRYRPTAGY